jgi:hypothetical protein
MANGPIALREPEAIAAGDTLLFQRRLPDYKASQGWSLTYILSDLQSNQVLTFPSAAAGDDHLISINAFAAALQADDYILAGYAVNGAERHEIYRAVLTLSSDFADNTAQGPQQTEAQEMIAILRDSLKALYRQQFQETDVQRNKFVMQKQGEVLQQLQYWKEMRLNEIQLERARNGKASGAVSVPRFCIG